MISAGVITHETLAWTEGYHEWKPLRQILGPSAPPPLPGVGNSTLATTGLKWATGKPISDAKSDSVIEISANSAKQAYEQILSHIGPLLGQGWKVDQSLVLAEGWKNSYALKRGDEQRTMDFDLRPTLPSLTGSARFEFTLMATTIGILRATDVAKITQEASRVLLTREQWKLRVREAEIALAALETQQGRPNCAARVNLERMKANPPTQFAPSPSGLAAALGRLLVYLFPKLMDGTVMNAWKAGRPPRLAPNPTDVNAVLNQVFDRLGSTDAGPKPALVQQHLDGKTGIMAN